MVCTVCGGIVPMRGRIGGNVRQFAYQPPRQYTSFRILMAYRQAGLFVTFLHDTNPDGFARMMNAILDGHPFAEAVMTGYETDLHKLWSRFVQANEN
jgi:hypothetical protein